MTTPEQSTSRPLSVVRTFSFKSAEEMVAVLGPHDGNIGLIEQAFPRLIIRPKGLDAVVTGPSETVGVVVRLLAELSILVENKTQIPAEVTNRVIAMMTASLSYPADVMSQNILSSRGKNIRPKTINQKNYVDAIDTNTVVFGIGPAGTGKTYLAMAKAVQALQAKEVNRIILTRPAVEAGERLGFLPGSLNDKIDPYLRPLYDALHDMMDPESIPRLIEAGTIEVAPLAYMRGRTLNDAFIILDEAQNTTVEQMKMFLTRLGFGSKMVITGDITQVDLPGGQISGLKQVRQIVEGIDNIHVAVLQAEDVVRHSLVSDIVSAYDRWDRAKSAMERRRNRKVKRQAIEAVAEKLLAQSSKDVAEQKESSYREEPRI